MMTAGGKLAAGGVAFALILGLHSGAQAAPVAYVTSQDGGVTVIDLDSLTVLKTFATGGKEPRGVAVTDDGRFVLTANKLTGDLSVINTSTGQVEQRIPIGKNPEFIRILGDLAYVTYEPGAAEERKAAAGADTQEGAPAEVAVIDLNHWAVIRSIPSGHETEGIEFSRDGKYMVVTNEGDNTISVYDRQGAEPIKTVKTDSYGNRPRGIKAFPGGQGYVVTLEFSDRFLVLDSEFNIVKSVATKKGPYGVAFDPEGKQLFIAASKSEVLQVFDAQTYDELGEISVGKRCWHFTFTPDGTKILAACGRSDALYVVDPRQRETVRIISGLKTPWGVVTYPKASGSLDTP
jgi:YVTN family beta-propeller protein